MRIYTYFDAIYRWVDKQQNIWKSRYMCVFGSCLYLQKCTCTYKNIGKFVFLLTQGFELLPGVVMYVKTCIFQMYIETCIFEQTHKWARAATRERCSRPNTAQTDKGESQRILPRFWTSSTLGAAGMLRFWLFPYCALMCHAEMLLVREGGCIVACCAGARVQACWSGGAVPVWRGDLPC